MRATASAAQSSSTTAAGDRGIAARILRGLGVSRSFRGSGASFVPVAVLALLAILAFAPGASAATKYFNSTIGGPGSTVGLTFGNAPRDVAVNEATGDFYVVDDANHRIQRVGADGSFVSMWGADVVQAGGSGDQGDAPDANFEICTVASECKAGVPSGGNGTPAGNGALDNPQGIAIDQDTGNVYVSDRDNRRISQYTADGEFVRSFGQGVVESGPGAQPPTSIDEIQTIRLFGPFDFGCFCALDVNGGTFTLSFDPDGGGPQPVETTNPIAFDAAVEDIEQHLADDLPSVAAGDIEVTGGPIPGSLLTLTFAGNYAGTDVAQVTGNASGLTPAGSTVVSATTTQGGPYPSYEVCEAAADICQAGIAADNVSGARPGQFSTGTVVNGYRIDVSKPDGDPATGNVYLANTGSQRVDAFELDGSSPTAFGSPTQFTSGHPLNVAVDSDEVVYVASHQPAQGARIVRYVASSDTFLDRINTDALVDGFGGIRRAGLEVDRLTGNLLVLGDGDFSAHDVVEIADPAGDNPTVADRHSTVSPITSHQAPSGLGIDPARGTFYVPMASPPAAQGRVFVFNEEGISPILAIPAGATNVGATSADLAATVNPAPNGPTGFATSYRFELSRTGIAGSWTQIGSDAVVPPDGDTDAASLVEAPVSGLEPNTFYRFRVVATRAVNTGGTISAEGVFLTDPAPPALSGLRSDRVRHASASLRGRVNPNNQETSYRFTYRVVGDSVDRQTPVRSAGSGGQAVAVAEPIDGLAPNTTYRYTLTATNATGTSTSAVRTFTTLAGAPAAGPECPNAEFRTGRSAHLPDCRAYEMVSPVDTNGGDITTVEEMAGIGSTFASGYHQASVDGGRITYSSASAFGGAVGGHWSNQYIASRGSGGWSTEPISSRRGRTVLEPGFTLAEDTRWSQFSFFQAFTPDLSYAWVRDDNVEPLAEGALEGYVNLYRRATADGDYEPLTTQGPFGSNTRPQMSRDDFSGVGGVRVVGVSTDLRHQVFVATAALTPDAIQSPSLEQGISQLYVLVDGELHLVSVLPDGTASSTNAFAGTASNGAHTETHRQMLSNAVSDDGSRIYWTAAAGISAARGPGRLYLRENPAEEQSAIAGGECVEPGKACTVHIAGTAVVGAGAQFWMAAADGSKMVYSTGSPPNRVVRLYDAEANTSTQIAAQSWGVAAAAEDLSHIYLVSRGALADGAVAGDNNLYDYHGGAHTFIAAVSDLDLSGRVQRFSVGTGSGGLGGEFSGQPQPLYNRTRVTPDGGSFVFMSNSSALAESTAGYDNRDAATGDPVLEVYRYSAEQGRLSCISCNPAGTRPHGALLQLPYSPIGREFTDWPNDRVGSEIPSWEHDNYASRLISDDGDRVFFHSRQALVDRDTNGAQDVYQWQAEGSGDCDLSSESYTSQNDGCIDLISTGRDGARSEFVDATPDGDEVYFTTDESIDPRDPGLRDIYVARVGGGFAPPEPSAAGCAVQAGGCQGGGAPPVAADGRTSAPTGGNAPRAERMRLAVAVASSRKARRLAARRGVLRVAVSASRPGVVRAVARARIGRRVRRVGGMAVRVRAAGRTVVGLRLTRQARRWLGAGRRLRVAVRVGSPGARPRSATVLLAGARS